MTISGNMKFFGANKIDANATFTFTSASQSLAKYLYDIDRTSKLISSGSDDLTDEVFTIEFAEAKTIDRIYVDNHNIKSGNLQYWNGASYTDFSAAISWTNNTDTTNYYEFNSVSTERLRLTMSTTQTADDEKYVGRLLAFEELGTVLANPSVYEPQYLEASKIHQTSNRGNVYVYFGSKFHTVLKFSDADSTDMTLFRTLKDQAQPFFFYPCGGDTSHLGINQEGYRIQDMYFVNYINAFIPAHKSVLGVGSAIEIELAEV